MTNKNGMKTERKCKNQADTMQHALTGQKNLNADADRARSFNHCKGTGIDKGYRRTEDQQANKVNRPADSGILIPAQGLEGEAPSGSEINRNDVSRCDQNLTNKAFQGDTVAKNWVTQVVNLEKHNSDEETAS